MFRQDSIRLAFLLVGALAGAHSCLATDPKKKDDCGFGALSHTGKGPHQVSKLTIPRLPSLEALRARIQKGPLPGRLPKILASDKLSNSRLMLTAEDGTPSFKAFLFHLQNNGLKTKNLTEEERQFLVEAVSYQVADLLTKGGLESLSGAPELLAFCGVNDFSLGPEFLAAYNYWERNTPIYPGGRISGTEYIGMNFNRQDRTGNEYLEDYGISLERSTGARPSDEEILDYLRIRNLRIALERRRMQGDLIGSTGAQTLNQAVRRIIDEGP